MTDVESEGPLTHDAAPEKAGQPQDEDSKDVEKGEPSDMDVEEDFEDFEDIDKPRRFETKARPFSEISSNSMPGGRFGPSDEPMTSSNPELAAPKTLDLKPPPWNPSDSKAVQRTPLAVDTSRRRYDDDDSLLKSPALAKFAIHSAEGTLPAMQMSPPRSSSGQSPENMQTLPPLRTAVSMDSAGSPGTFSMLGQSPAITRPSPGQMSQFGPSPSSYNHPSPGMSPPNVPGFYRSTFREGSMSTTEPSDYSLSTPTSVPTPATTVSTVSYGTSAAHIVEHHHSFAKVHSRKSSIDAPAVASTSILQTTEPSPQKPASRPQINGEYSSTGTQQQNSPTSATSCSNQSPTQGQQQQQPILPNAYKCTFPGCTSAPFGTQYLLNSHANVHSSSRPHFCPVRGCNRGPGGQGFKRKNEMIR